MLASIITTIPKPGKTNDSPTNFRPISLLNNDINFFSKIIANWLNEVLPSPISQVGFIKNRQTRHGTRRILDLIQLAKLSSEEAVLVSLDAKKAFDRVNWSYLQRVLLKVGLTGPIFTAICSLYMLPSATVFTSGFHHLCLSYHEWHQTGLPPISHNL